MQPAVDKTQTAKSRIVFELGNGTLEIFDLDPSESLLFDLLKDLFENHWEEIVFGILIQGAAWEIKADHKPESVTLHDGYLTVDFGHWHFHICIGENKGSKAHPTDPELKAHRRTSRAELYRQLSESGTPNYWGLRLYNVAWGIALGAATLLATASAGRVYQMKTAISKGFRVGIAFATAFLVFEAAIYAVAFFFLGGLQDFTMGIVSHVFVINVTTFAGLVVLHSLLSQKRLSTVAPVAG